MLLGFDLQALAFPAYPLQRQAFYNEYHSYWLSSPATVWTVYSLYGLACAFVALFLKNRRAVSFPRWMIIAHNAIQVLLSGTMVCGLVICAYRAGYSLSGNMNFDASRAADPSRAVWERGVMFFIRLFTLSKFYDLVDTLIIVLTKKDAQFTFLHCSHHCIVPVAVWYGMGYSPAGDSYMPALFNSFVHLVMYSYYLLSTLRIPCPWKQMLTQLQLVQFAWLFAFGMNCLHVGSIAWQTTAVNTIVQVAMLLMFGNFYLSKYDTKPNASPNTGVTATSPTLDKSLNVKFTATKRRSARTAILDVPN